MRDVVALRDLAHRLLALLPALDRFFALMLRELGLAAEFDSPRLGVGAAERRALGGGSPTTPMLATSSSRAHTSPPPVGSLPSSWRSPCRSCGREKLAALEKAKSEKEAHGEFESECPGYCGAQDTFYVGNMKSVGRIYQQTFIDTYAKVAFAKLYDRKTPITAADLVNDRVVPFYDAHEVKLCRVLTDRGTEYCGNPEHHEYELYLALEDVDHSRTKTKSPQTNGIVERFHKTVLDEFYRVAFRKKIYGSIGELQSDLDDWVKNYNEERPHQGRWCFGKTPIQTFLDATPLAKEKMIAA